MSQNSFSISNQSRTAYRAAVNAALQALVSLSSGAAAPSTTYAYQLWADTTTGLLKIRDAGNANWVSLGPLDGTSVLTPLLQVIKAGAAIGLFDGRTGGNAGAALKLLGWNTTNKNWQIDTALGALAGLFFTPSTAAGGSTFTTPVASLSDSGWFQHTGTITKRKTADESVTSSTALQDDDHLTFPIAANEEWTADFFIDVGAALTTTGARVALNAPAGATINVMSMCSSFASSSMAKRTTTIGAALAYPLGGFGAADPSFMMLTAWVLNGATPGNVTLQWCQDTSSGTALTFRKGSHIQATRLA